MKIAKSLLCIIFAVCLSFTAFAQDYPTGGVPDLTPEDNMRIGVAWIDDACTEFSSEWAAVKGSVTYDGNGLPEYTEHNISIIEKYLTAYGTNYDLYYLVGKNYSRLTTPQIESLKRTANIFDVKEYVYQYGDKKQYVYICDFSLPSDNGTYSSAEMTDYAIRIIGEYVNTLSVLSALDFTQGVYRDYYNLSLLPEQVQTVLEKGFRDDYPVSTPIDISLFAKGDVNFDGKVSVDDARLVLRYAIGLTKTNGLSVEKRALADMDGDRGITVADARIILRTAIGLE